MTICSMCKSNAPLPRQRYCRECKNLYGRRWRDKQPRPERGTMEYQKMMARHYLRVYVHRGLIPKGPCEVCNATENVEAHHEDYFKPFKVRWLCRAHHVDTTCADYGLKRHTVETGIFDES